MKSSCLQNYRLYGLPYEYYKPCQDFKVPAAEHIDVLDDGRIVGLFTMSYPLHQKK